ncbi:MAG: DUF4296 domain-containing protein [Dysgonamonadaceae bacterium]|nr:DUF4296 domain-containing protein [Dysgonamonadaceae bacterium]MDD4605079.1 DUF4296 domain-containing protein [Dysgonamonadaceae bacterium]
MNNLIKSLFFLIVATTVFACQNRPKEVLSRKKMENLMYDMYIAEAIIDNDYQEFALPEKKEALIDQVLKKHKISEARWDTSLSWYSDNIDLYLQINDSVKARLQRNKDMLEQANMQLVSRELGDDIKSPDYIPLHFRVGALGCDRGFKFTLDSLQLIDRFLENDTIFFQFKSLGIYPLETYSLKSVLKIDYSDTTVFEVSELDENKLYSFPVLKSIDQDTIKSLYGLINLSGKLPLVPIQLYEISLGSKENEKDSLDFIQLADTMMLLEKPERVIE